MAIMIQTETSKLCDAISIINVDREEKIPLGVITKLAEHGMIEFVGNRIVLTRKGRDVCDRLESGDLGDDDLSGAFQ
jgi:predicted methyltransferase